MNANCNDCINIKNLELRLDKVETSIDKFEERITDLERKSDVSGEQIKMIYKILNEIKDSIREIGNKIDVIEQKPAQRWDEAIKTVIAVLVTGAVTYFVSKK